MVSKSFFAFTFAHVANQALSLLQTKGFKAAKNYFLYSLFDSMAAPEMSTFERGLYRLYKTYEFNKLKYFPWESQLPDSIEIETTTKCNLKCIMCEHTYWNEKTRDMSFQEFKKIVNQFPRLRYVGMTGIGSSFLNSDYLEMLQYLKERSIFVELFDHFYNINEELSRKLIEIEIDKIWFSIDAATKETYEKIRVGADFERVTENFKTFVKLKREMKNRLPDFVLHYIVLGTNLHEVPQFIDLVSSFGLKSEETIIQFTPMLHPFEEVKNLATEIPERIIREAEDKASKLNFQVLWNQNTRQTKPPIDKCRSWKVPFIEADGTVQPCCAINEANRRAFIKNNSIGNLLEEPFLKIWNTKYKELVNEIIKGQVPTLCKQCTLFDVREDIR